MVSEGDGRGQCSVHATMYCTCTTLSKGATHITVHVGNVPVLAAAALTYVESLVHMLNDV